jgi:HK97 family phage prohead protease/HK97 family phage major capsid protein
MTTTRNAPEARPADQVEYLEFQVLAPTQEQVAKREFTGLALPYGEEMQRLDIWTGATRQVFEAESAKVRENAQIFFGHDHQVLGMPVGRIKSWEHTPQGLKITGRLATTAKAEDVYTLMTPDEDGQAVLDRLSVGYIPVKNVLEDADTKDPLLRHLEVDVFETSIVPTPQYDSAKVSQVLAAHTPRKEPSMTTTTTEPETLATKAEFEALTASLDNLERRMATLGQPGDDEGHAVPFTSYGEFLQALSQGDDQAMQFLAYVGGVVGDLDGWVKDSWVGDLYRPLAERRRVLNLFNTRPLPASGMQVEYGKLLADTTQVAEQAAEGDALAYGKITFTTDTAPLKTYGGWGEMSRQEIDRSAMAVVEKFFTALLRRYNQATEAAVRAVAVDPANATELPGAAPDLGTIDGWVDFLVDASFALDDEGLAPDFALVGRDVFKDLAKMRLGTDGPFFLDRNSGTVNVTGLSGEVFNVPVVPISQNGLVRVCDASAIVSFEAGGAPFRMQDDDIVHLTKAFSIYGYLAVAPTDVKAIIRPNDGV